MIEVQPIWDEVKLIIPKVWQDNRGFFMESYHYQQLTTYGIKDHFIQDNHSLSVEKGTLRGLHYQLNPGSQAKLIRVIRGSIFDVVVDIRRDSVNFGKWFSVEISDKNKKQLYIPKGFAHGFCTLEANTEVIYKVDEYYYPALDRGIIWNDPTLQIDWPTSRPILSEKDKQHPAFIHAEVFEDDYVTP
ncbi:dTDP-4-dehydrorhamnose 3,5-epimerase [Gracilibacillus timonensis]|uniref:dTDP-4-dehydrorhamnose 3,5-epimerase n=1 Tax=Gracilibacillus timonensis TaxID=1816696 RepID=UPI000B1CE2BF|nr:dTDP-4-dehydrorhamnose 3,5-epimerase [Gracilibacillus timonensis]